MFGSFLLKCAFNNAWLFSTGSYAIERTPDETLFSVLHCWCSVPSIETYHISSIRRCSYCLFYCSFCAPTIQEWCLVCVWVPCLLAMATIWGRCFFHSRAYNYAATIQGWQLHVFDYSKKYGICIWVWLFTRGSYVVERTPQLTKLYYS